MMAKINWSNEIEFVFTTPWYSSRDSVARGLAVAYQDDMAALGTDLGTIRQVILGRIQSNLPDYIRWNVAPQDIHEFFDVNFTRLSGLPLVAYVVFLPKTRSKILLQVEFMTLDEAQAQRSQMKVYHQMRRTPVIINGLE